MPTINLTDEDMNVLRKSAEVLQATGHMMNQKNHKHGPVCCAHGAHLNDIRARAMAVDCLNKEAA